ncbi:MAG: uroporphyrinogen-III synthase [Micrococcaceae bacterium]|nr:uroporphyrinogen-III synthase [Micrococcaceae bacterium]
MGAATARALADHGVGVDFVPAGTSSAAGMLAEWPEGLDMRWKASVARRSGGRGVAGADTSSPGLGTRAGTGATGHAGSATGTAGAGSPGDVPRALLPVSALASDTLEDGLRARGYRVCRVRAYDMEPAPAPRPLSTIASEPDDAAELDRAAARAACASGELSAVVVTAPSRAGQLLDGNRPAEGTAWIAIGEPTARALREQGLTPVTAAQPTPEALADAVVQALGTPGTAGRNKFS